MVSFQEVSEISKRDQWSFPEVLGVFYWITMVFLGLQGGVNWGVYGGLRSFCSKDTSGVFKGFQEAFAMPFPFH